MSKATRKARAAAARPGTIAADHRIAIDDRPARTVYTDGSKQARKRYCDPSESFTDEELATLPLRITNAPSSRVLVWRGPDGTWYRNGAWLRIRPRKDGAGREYQIVLLKGANRDDLQVMLRAIARLRNGEHHQRWKRVNPTEPGWEWADDQTYTYSFCSRTYNDPYTHSDRSPDVTACTEPRCRDRWDEEYGVHVVDEVKRTFESDSGPYSYSVRVTRGLDEDQWSVDVYTDDFFGTPDDVARLLNDLQWMQEECRRANQPNERANGEALPAPLAVEVEAA